MTSKQQLEAQIAALRQQQNALRAEYNTMLSSLSISSSLPDDSSSQNTNSHTPSLAPSLASTTSTPTISTISTISPPPPYRENNTTSPTSPKPPNERLSIYRSGDSASHPSSVSQTPLSSYSPRYSVASSTSSLLADKNANLRKTHAKYLEQEKAKREEANPKQYLDLVFLVDCTASMTKAINAVAAKLLAILDLIGYEFPNVETKVAFVGYRDIGDSEQYVIHDFQEPSTIRPKIERIKAAGGSDFAEDVLGGYEKVLTALSWPPRAKRHRCLLHFLDAPPHGKRFHGIENDTYDRFWLVQPPSKYNPSTKLEHWVQVLCAEKIFCNMFAVRGIGVEDWIEQTVREFKDAFESVRDKHGMDKFTFNSIAFSTDTEKSTDVEIKAFVDRVLKAVVDSLVSSGARRTPATSNV